MEWLKYILGFVVLRLLEYIIVEFEPRAKKTKTKIDDHIIKFLKYIISSVKFKKK